MFRIPAIAAAIELIASPALAAGPCKDAKGKFTKCPRTARHADERNPGSTTNMGSRLNRSTVQMPPATAAPSTQRSRSRTTAAPVLGRGDQAKATALSIFSLGGRHARAAPCTVS